VVSVVSNLPSFPPLLKGDAWYSSIYQYNCTDSMLPRVVGIPHTNFRPAFEALATISHSLDEVRRIHTRFTVLVLLPQSAYCHLSLVRRSRQREHDATTRQECENAHASGSVCRSDDLFPV
jgi:hypothetical protein